MKEKQRNHVQIEWNHNRYLTMLTKVLSSLSLPRALDVSYTAGESTGCGIQVEMKDGMRLLSKGTTTETLTIDQEIIASLTAQSTRDT